MAGQQPQLDPYLMPQVQAQPVPPVLPPPPQVVAPPLHQVHGMPVAMPPQGQHYVYVSTPTPQTVQNVLIGYAQTMQTAVKMELGNSPSVTPPVATTLQTPQSMPKTPKSDSKENSDSDKNDGEKSKSKKKCESVKKKVRKIQNMIHQETKTKTF